MVDVFCCCVNYCFRCSFCVCKKGGSKPVGGKYPEGHFLGQGMASFMGVGVALGLVLDNLSLGIAIGLPIGLAIGYVWEGKAKKKGKIRPLTKEERARKVLILKLVLGLGLLLFLLFAYNPLMSHQGPPSVDMIRIFLIYPFFTRLSPGQTRQR